VIKTPADIERQKEDLLRRKPVLRNLRIVPLRESPLAGKTEDIAAFIDECWADTYGNQDRFNYETDYLEWVFGDGGLDSDASLVALREKEVVGLGLATPRTLRYDGREHKTLIFTALSIHPRIKAEGLGRYLFLNCQEIAARRLPCFIVWYHSSIANPFSSHQVHTIQERDYFDHWGDYHLLSRILDYNRANDNARLRWYEQVGLRLFSGRKSPGGAMPVTQIATDNVEEVCAALNDDVARQGEGRVFTVEELQRYACFRGRRGSFGSAGWFYRDLMGRIAGVAIGYSLETIGKNRDRLFFLDHFFPGPEKSSFIRAVEAKVDEQFGVYGLVTLDGRLGIREGYLPSLTILSCYSISFCEEIRKRDSRNRPFPIIDHK
jgi:hypothetical protein